MTSLLGAFNNHFLEFIEDLIIIFPHDNEIKTLKTAFSTLKSVNPKAVLKIWSKYILKYRTEIEQGDISFFINKNYDDDLSESSKKDDVAKIIQRLREPVQNMSQNNQDKAMKYIQNLTKICVLYNSS